MFGNFIGGAVVAPPLNRAEIAYLERFSGSRRMRRRSGPYSTEAFDILASDHVDVIDLNDPANPSSSGTTSIKPSSTWSKVNSANSGA